MMIKDAEGHWTKAPSFSEEALRRRKANEGTFTASGDNAPGDSNGTELRPIAESSASDDAGSFVARRSPLMSGSASGPKRQTGSAPRKESIFDKIKRVASQPALAGPSAPSITTAAQHVITSLGPNQSGKKANPMQKVATALQPIKSQSKPTAGKKVD